MGADVDLLVNQQNPYMDQAGPLILPDRSVVVVFHLMERRPSSSDCIQPCLSGRYRGLKTLNADTVR